MLQTRPPSSVDADEPEPAHTHVTHRMCASTPECSLDDCPVSLRPPPIPLVYNTANLIGVDWSMRIPLCTIL